MTWKKGESGNPAGRAAGWAHIEKLAKTRSLGAIDALCEIFANPEEPASARVAAANAVLDRGYGKPKATADVHVSGQVDHVHVLTEALTIVEQRRRKGDHAIDVTPDDAKLLPAAEG